MAHRVAIIGRPNVGKSTLFNRIVGRRHSITERTSGTTRDRVEAVVKSGGLSFEIVDTGGFDMASGDHMSKLVKRQIEAAIKTADTILFVCDIKDGVTRLDEEILPILRKSGKGIILTVNKADNEKVMPQANEFFTFGIEDIYPVSALHNIGISALMDRLEAAIKPSDEPEQPAEQAIRVAIVGRPNVGKSSFINRIMNEERMIVHEVPGTTRDSIDICLSREGTDFILIDTAGMRHKRKIKEAVDVYGLLRARESVRHSDVCLVMIDGYEGLTRDDMGIIRLVEESGKGCIFIVNKWDLVSRVEMVKYEKALVKKAPYLKNVPILFTSCKTGLNLEEPLRLVKMVDRNVKMRFTKAELDGILDVIHKTNRLPAVRSGRLIKIYRIRQKEAAPPTFSLLVNRAASVTDDYIEAVKNVMREELGLTGAPINITVSGGEK